MGFWGYNRSMLIPEDDQIVMPNGDVYYIQNGESHRLDGAAVERVNGKNEWWIKGRRMSEQAFNNYIRNSNDETETNPTISATKSNS